jgi:hypothetical protein
MPWTPACRVRTPFSTDARVSFTGTDLLYILTTINDGLFILFHSFLIGLFDLLLR